MRKFAACLLILILFSVSVGQTLAKRVLPRFSTSSAGGTTATGTGSVKVTVKFRADRKAITATFANLSTAASVDYILNYTSKNIPQGASGTITPDNEDPVVRELLFGTCSHGVCRYDTGITNAKFTVTISYKNGKKVIKNYRLKV